jgi:hypothetical protein
MHSEGWRGADSETADNVVEPPIPSAGGGAYWPTHDIKSRHQSAINGLRIPAALRNSRYGGFRVIDTTLRSMASVDRL